MSTSDQLVNGMSPNKTPIVSTLGPAGTYSHQASATLEFFGSAADLRLEETITAIFEAVERGTSQFGVAPIENSTNGIVAETHACLYKFNTHEQDRTRLSISHALLRQPGSDGVPVKIVYGHEQSIGQSRRYLAARFPSATIQEVNSTALASQYASNHREAAAVCSLQCAELYGLDVVDTDIQDGEGNRTTFIKFVKR